MQVFLGCAFFKISVILSRPGGGGSEVTNETGVGLKSTEYLFNWLLKFCVGSGGCYGYFFVCFMLRFYPAFSFFSAEERRWREFVFRILYLSENQVLCPPGAGISILIFPPCSSILYIYIEIGILRHTKYMISFFHTFVCEKVTNVPSKSGNVVFWT